MMPGVPPSVTPEELYRDVVELRTVQDQHRAEMRAEMREGFAKVETAIAGLTFVHPDMLIADQARQDTSVAALDARVGKVESEIVQQRRMLWSTLLAPVLVVLVTAVLYAVFGLDG